MFELVQCLLFVLGIAAARLANPGDACALSPCPPISARPIAAWSSPEPLRADEFRLFARGERRPGQPSAAPIVFVPSERVWFIGPASERVRPRLARASRLEVSVPDAASAR